MTYLESCEEAAPSLRLIASIFRACTWMTPSYFCSGPSTSKYGRPNDCQAIRFEHIRHDDRLNMPVSSSTLKKTMPLAVPGRCRTMTQPATRTNIPFRWFTSHAAGVTPIPFHTLSLKVHRMTADGERAYSVWRIC